MNLETPNQWGYECDECGRNVKAPEQTVRLGHLVHGDTFCQECLIKAVKLLAPDAANG